MKIVEVVNSVFIYKMSVLKYLYYNQFCDEIYCSIFFLCHICVRPAKRLVFFRPDLDQLVANLISGCPATSRQPKQT